MGTHLKLLNESYPMNTNMRGLDVFQKYLCSCALDESSLSIGRVKSSRPQLQACSSMSTLEHRTEVQFIAFIQGR